jgi:outer membrane receptor protein involved in Fe transport
MDGLPTNTVTPGYFSRGLPMSALFPRAGIETDAYAGFSTGRNDRTGMTQEVRFNSSGEARPLSWVAGVFYSNFNTRTRQTTLHGEDDISAAFYGLTIVQRYGQTLLPVPDTGQLLLWDDINQRLRDTEYAVFGEGNYWITDKLRATLGLRWSRVEFDYRMTLYGPSNRLGDPATGAALNGTPPQPSVANGGIVTGSTADSPLTPKISLQYQLADNDMVYVSAAKGFRAGGVNGNQSPGICLPALALQGIDFDALSRTFDSDSVWSYEGGAKLRVLNNRVQVNGALFRIDWDNMQFSTSVSGCPFVSNIGSARSQGGELEVNAAVARGLLANLAVGYTDAKYTADTFTPGRTPQLVAADGQPFPVARWTVNVGARFDHGIRGDVRGYVRGDWRWASSYEQNFFGVVGYNPDTHSVEPISRTNLRLGVEYGDFDINLFANNLFNQQSGPRTGGRGGCNVAGGLECTNYNSYNPVFGVVRGIPRTIGLQVVYRR